MAERAPEDGDLYKPEHGSLTERTTPVTEYKHGHMDVTEQQRTFEGFITFWIYLFSFSALVLIFLAIFAT